MSLEFQGARITWYAGLLAEAGYPNSFTMDFNIRQQDQFWAQAVASMWANIGVKTNALASEAGALNRRWWAKQLKGVGSILGSTAPDQTGYVYAFLANGQTWSYYNDAYLNSATARLYTIVDPEAREKLMRDIGRYMVEKAMNVFIVHGNQVFGGGPRVADWPLVPGQREPLGIQRIRLKR